MKTAILVDGGFYRKRARHLWGDKNPEERARELWRYCNLHISDGKDEHRNLYRILYYDCPPLDGNVYDPITKKSVNYSASAAYKWTTEFFSKLVNMRKVALRKGVLLPSGRALTFNSEATKELLSGKLKLEDVEHRHLIPMFHQKGVDIKIGIDIVHFAYKKIVDQIILVTGDSDFVPAAKIARTEGVDVILDPMGTPIAKNLAEHVDGLFSHWRDGRMNDKESVRP